MVPSSAQGIGPGGVGGFRLFGALKALGFAGFSLSSYLLHPKP